jgi:hypothetical protein
VTTQATTDTASGRLPDRAAAIPIRRFLQDTLRNAPRFFQYVWQNEKHWLLFLVPFALILGYTYTLAQKSWTDFDSPLVLQPWVPLFAAWLVWHRRRMLTAQYRELAFMFPDDSPKRNGKVWGIVAGCVLMLLASFAMLAPMATFGLIVAIAGTVYYIYGPFIFRSVWQPLAFLFLMLPLPGGFLQKITSLLQLIAAFVSTQIFSFVYPGTKQLGGAVLLGGNTPMFITPSLAGAAVVVPLLMLTLWLCILRRIRVAPSLVILMGAFVIGVVLNTVRLIAFGFISVNAPRLAEMLMKTNSWLLVGIGFYGTFLLAKRLTRPRRLPGMAEAEEDDDEDDFDYTDEDDVTYAADGADTADNTKGDR